jgi:hypothetical protein
MALKSTKLLCIAVIILSVSGLICSISIIALQKRISLLDVQIKELRNDLDQTIYAIGSEHE